MHEPTPAGPAEARPSKRARGGALTARPRDGADTLALGVVPRVRATLKIQHETTTTTATNSKQKKAVSFFWRVIQNPRCLREIDAERERWWW